VPLLPGGQEGGQGLGPTDGQPGDLVVQAGAAKLDTGQGFLAPGRLGRGAGPGTQGAVVVVVAAAVDVGVRAGGGCVDGGGTSRAGPRWSAAVTVPGARVVGGQIGDAGRSSGGDQVAQQDQGVGGVAEGMVGLGAAVAEVAQQRGQAVAGRPEAGVSSVVMPRAFFPYARRGRRAPFECLDLPLELGEQFQAVQMRPGRSLRSHPPSARGLSGIMGHRPAIRLDELIRAARSS